MKSWKIFLLTIALSGTSIIQVTYSAPARGISRTPLIWKDLFTTETLMAATGGGNVPAEVMSLLHNANSVGLSISNVGIIGLDPTAGTSYSSWPYWTGNNYVFGMGVWIGGLADVDGDGTKDTVVVMGYNTTNGDSEHAEGRVGQDPADPLARVFSSTNPQDLNEWPDEFRNEEGLPIIHSIQDFVTIYNDITGTPIYGAGRCGIEVKQRSMAFVGGLNFNAILIFFEFTNRSDSLPQGPYALEEAYVAFVSDTDIGESFSDDMSSVLDSVEVYGRDVVELNTGMAWDRDFDESGWEGKVGFVGVHFLQPPGNPWDGIDNDGDGIIDESPFDGIDDDSDGVADDIPDEVDTVNDFHYSWFASPSAQPPLPDPTSDEAAYRMMRCLTEGDCGEFDLDSDIRFMISNGSFDLPPGESQIAAVAIVFANPVGDPDHLDLYGDPPRPDPQDSVLTEFVATILGTRALYESGFEDELAPFMIFGTTPLEDTNDPLTPFQVSTNIIDSIPLARNTLNYSVDGAPYEEVLLEHFTGNIYTGEIPGQWFWSTVSYYVQAVDSAFQVLRDPWNAPDSAFHFQILDVPDFAGFDCSACGEATAAAAADFDLDGSTDIFMVTTDGAVLYRNTGDFTFEDVTAASGITAPTNTKGGSWGDYDDDGYPDLFIAAYTLGNTHFLYHNSGDGTFEDVTLEAGVADSIATSSGIWGDVNGDGLLDLFTAQFLTDRLYINNGDGTFEDLAGQWQIEEEVNDRAASFFDKDGDGDLDLLLTGSGESFLYANLEGQGFTDVTPGSNLADGSWNSIATGDYDGDGDMDLLLSGSVLTLYENTSGMGSFLDVTEEVGLSGLCDDASWADFNSDGLLDIITTSPTIYIRSPDGTFRDLTEVSGIFSTGVPGGFVLPDDLDKNGLMDLAHRSFFENGGYAGYLPRHWLELILEGTVSNRGAVGSVVRAYAGELSSTRFVSGGEGKSQESPLLHFGLDTLTVIDSLVIDWPSGIRQKLEGLAADQLYQVLEDSTLGIGDGNERTPLLPRSYSLMQNYPNPFNPQTVITFDIPPDPGYEAVKTRLIIFDMRGRMVKVLVDGAIDPGRHSIIWDGRMRNGERASSGIYFYRLEAGSFKSTRKMLLLK